MSLTLSYTGKLLASFWRENDRLSACRLRHKIAEATELVFKKSIPNATIRRCVDIYNMFVDCINLLSSAKPASSSRPWRPSAIPRSGQDRQCRDKAPGRDSDHKFGAASQLFGIHTRPTSTAAELGRAGKTSITASSPCVALFTEATKECGRAKAFFASPLFK